VALLGQWHYSLITDTVTATLQIAKRAYSLAQEQNDARLLMGAYRVLAGTFFYLGDFESARQYAMRAVQIWRLGSLEPKVSYRALAGSTPSRILPSRIRHRRSVIKFPSPTEAPHPEDLDTPVVGCLCYQAKSEWHLGEVASSKATIAEAISVARKLNDMHTLASALYSAAILCYYELKFADVERLASDLMELSTRHNFVYWLAWGVIFRGWARSASGETAEGIPGLSRE
jgi:hypothetical protein